MVAEYIGNYLIQFLYFAGKKNEDTASLSDKHKTIEEMGLKPRKCLNSMQWVLHYLFIYIKQNIEKLL